MKRTALARGATPLARTSGLARVAGLRRNRPQRPPSRPAHLDVPADTRAAVLARSGGRCEAGIAGVCLGAATDLHHRRKRGVGPHPHAPYNLIHICRQDHDWIHAHPEEARGAGWIVSQYGSCPSTVPVAIRGRLLRLAADSTYLEDER